MKQERILIEKNVYGGEGIGKLPDGRSVFVPYVLPGEDVLVEIITEKKRYAKGVPVRWYSQSPKRIQPPCPYFGECGGCHYQCLTYGDQLLLKEKILRDQFQRIGGIEALPLTVVELSDKELGYRNTIRLHVSEDGQIGYLRQNAYELIPIEDCLLAKGNLKKILKQLTFEAEMGIHSVQLRWDSQDEVLIVFESEEIIPPEVSVDFPGSIVHLSPAGLMVLVGDETQVFEVEEIPFAVSAQSFFQANTDIAERMVAFLRRYIPEKDGGLLMDLYSGVGLFSRFFAPNFSQCVAIESSPSAVNDYATNLDDFDHIQLYEGTVEDILPSLEISPNVVILDPPRTGLDASVVDWLAEKRIGLLAYVSCDPSTAARDVKRLIEQGYHLEEVALFDQFPQTYHIEIISILTR